jgi:plastocyanin
VRRLLLLTFLSLAAACADTGDSTKPPASRGDATPAVAVPTGSSTISGVVHAPDAALRGRRVQMNADPACARLHPAPPVDHLVEVNSGLLEGAVVFVKSGPIGRGYPPPSKAAVLDQQGCLYQPRVVALQVGQSLDILNSDPTLHNVHAVAASAGGFNAAMPLRGQKITKRFSAPELFVRMKCDVHPWMEAHAAVFDHPFFAITGADGRFSIAGLPAGTYTVGVAHPVLGTVDQTVELAEGGKAALKFTLGGDAS